MLPLWKLIRTNMPALSQIWSMRRPSHHRQMLQCVIQTIHWSLGIRRSAIIWIAILSGRAAHLPNNWLVEIPPCIDRLACAWNCLQLGWMRKQAITSIPWPHHFWRPPGLQTSCSSALVSLPRICPCPLCLFACRKVRVNLGRLSNIPAAKQTPAAIMEGLRSHHWLP